MKRNILLFIIAVMASGILFGQNEKWTWYYANPEVHCTAIQGDTVWAGTEIGLFAIDRKTGIKLSFYNNRNTCIPNNRINAITLDKEGNKWICTKGGVIKYDGNNWTLYNSKNSGLHNDDFQTITIDNNGNKWIGTRNNGFWKFDGKNCTNYNKYNSELPNCWVTTIAIDKDGTKWIGTYGGGLVKFDDKNWTIYNKSNSKLPGDIVYVIQIDKDGKKLIGTNGIYSEFDNKNWKIYDTLNLINPLYLVETITIDSNNTIWLGSYSILVSFDGKIWNERYRNNSGLFSCKINSINIDKEGQLWIGSDFGLRLFRSDSNNYSVINMNNSEIPDNIITSVAIDKDGSKWVGTSRGLAKYNDKNWVIYDDKNSAIKERNNSIKNLAVDKEGIKWISNYLSIIKYNNKNWTVYNLNDLGLPQNSNIYELAIENNGVIWIGTSNGIVKFDGQKSLVYNMSNSGLPGDMIYCIGIDKDGKKWISTSGGLAVFDDKTWKVYNTSNSGIPDNVAMAIDFDNENNKWFLIRGQLVKFDDKEWYVYNSNNSGLPDSYLFSLKIDKSGIFWIGLSGELIRWDKVNSKVYNIYNSLLPGSQINNIKIDDTGNKWIGTIGGGLIKFNDEIVNTTISGRVYFDRNKNKIKDQDEKYISGQHVMLLPDSVITTTDETGVYRFYVKPGNYFIQYQGNSGWGLSTDSLKYFAGLKDTNIVIKDFGVFSKSINSDAVLKLTLNTTIERCGRVASYFIDYSNKGIGTAEGRIVFRKEKREKIENSYPQIDSISKDSSLVLWNYKGLYATEGRQIRIDLRMPGVEALGDTLISSAEGIIDKSEKNFSKVIYAIHKTIIKCSCDPNEKAVEPIGIGTEHQTLFSDTLRYTIHFQNTGNDTAFDIKVMDTLSKKLDWSTFNVVASSHKVNTSIDKNGVVTFMFNNIMLPDSGKDYLGSNGFVTYEIVPKKDALPFEIKNTGYIYFDYNPAVVTNTVSNEMVAELPGKAGISEKLKVKNEKLVVYPNPSTGILNLECIDCGKVISVEVLDITGRVLFNGINAKVINIGNLDSGIYFVRLMSERGEFMNMVVKQP